MKQVIGRLVVLALAALLLGACAGPVPTQATNYQMTLPQFPSLLTVHSPVQPPPDRTLYVNSTWQQKEQQLTDAYNHQTTNLMTCNIDKDKINTWYSQQAAIVAQTNAASGAVAASGTQVGK